MQQTWVLYPAFAMALLSFAVAAWLLRCRFKAVAEGTPAAYFQFNRGAKLPDYLVQATQHYDNQFEMPTLFYAAVLIAYVTQQVDAVSVTLAWLYVASRYLHTWVHLTANRLRKRMRVFVFSYAVLVGLWGWVLVEVAGV